MTPRLGIGVGVLFALHVLPPPTAHAQRAEAPLGSRDNPVRAEGPPGEREYLARLRCTSGAAPDFARLGSVGEHRDGHILDAYTLACDRPLPERGTTGDATPDSGLVEVFLDMYHEGYREMAPIAGFTVLSELPGRAAPGCPPRVAGNTESIAWYVFSDLEVEQPVGLSAPFDVEEPFDVGREGMAFVEVVIDTAGRAEPASVKVRFITDETLRPHIAAALARIPFSPAEHHAGCKVRQGIAVPIAFR